MYQVFYLYIWFPLLAYFISLFVPRTKEKIISGLAIATTGIHLVCLSIFTAFWAIDGGKSLNIDHILLYEGDEYRIAIEFYFDKITAVFACIGSLLTFLVAVYSKYFIHREGGFKRFFNTIILFFFAYNTLIFSGNFETLFVGWEILGVCTFLLVSFYRERYLPVKNSMKVISVYRLGDICLMLAMWMSHHLLHRNISFQQLNDGAMIGGLAQTHFWEILFISCMILVAAAVKSAQLPFSSWLPRAMEGPTTSSAIFYGSLSVHIGVFLLLRTYGYWEHVAAFKALVIFTGLSTSIVAISIAKLQSSLKPQIAYSSIAQIGLMFIEIALGFHTLALFHFAGNACLRTYQLLVSPSVQHYLIHDMFFNFTPKPQVNNGRAFAKLKNSFYLLSLKEWNLDTMQHRFLWSPFKWIGRKVGFLSGKVATAALIALFASGIYCYYMETTIPVDVFSTLPLVFSFIGLMLILKSFSDRGDAMHAWLSVAGGQLFIVLAVALHNEDYSHGEILLLLSGSLVSAVVGFICLYKG